MEKNSRFIQKTLDYFSLFEKSSLPVGYECVG